MRASTQFVCQQCGYASAKWLGRCPDCSSWNSLCEERVMPQGHRGESPRSGVSAKITPVTDIPAEGGKRISLPSEEFNRVLGGGLTMGSAVLLAGDPGIGKSTLLLQTLGKLAAGSTGPALYVSGEESAAQLRQRAERLGVMTQRLHVLAHTDALDILEHLRRLSPQIVVVDSIQTLSWPELSSVPGSIGQVREVADRLVRYAKESGAAMFLVGHITKEGGIAGPMTLEHLVDTVLFFTGDRGHNHRILHARKNRFGPTDEIGVFEMDEKGLCDVTNASELFLRDRPRNTPGTVVFPSIEGSRPVLVEVQGLTSRSQYAVANRTCVGFDRNRLTMLIAVMEKRGGLRLEGQDVYVNVAGGLRLSDPAADLAVACAVASSFLGRAWNEHTVVLGEIGLAGEIRSVARTELRLREASRLGFRHAVVPDKARGPGGSFSLEIVRSVADAVNRLD